MTRSHADPAPADLTAPCRWLDFVKAAALVWICAGHVVEQLFGYPLLGNPGAGWPPLADRLAQLTPLPVATAGDWAWNAVRYLGWLGDLGVPIFLVASGFGLAWGLLHRGAPASLPWLPFMRRRAARIYPQWVLAHLMFAVPAFLLGVATWLIEPRFALSLLGIRATPGLLYYLSPAWWYVGLLLQLYAVFPGLWGGLRRFGTVRFAALVGGGAVALRLAGLWVCATWAPGFLDAWSRGAVFVTHLPEFVVGMCLAATLHRSRGSAPPTATLALLVAAATAGLGVAASLTLSGMAVAPVLTGAGLFALFAGAAARFGWHGALVGWVARHSLALFLVHHPLVIWLIPDGALRADPSALAGRVAAVLTLTVVGSLLLEFTAQGITKRLRDRAGRRLLVRRSILVAATTVAALLGAEFALRRYDPQEVLGWGERAALCPDTDVDWKLRPARRTRLAWESYDYEVRSNRLGFPGPDYAEARPADGLRLLVTGDAFSSAEGVDTDQSWPRRLEDHLRFRLPKTPIEVWNFGITGHGPNQYAKVVATFAPRCRPDLIVIGMFVNDFRDALTAVEEFHRSIGFGRRDPNSLAGYARLPHLRTWLRLNLGRWKDEWLRGVPFSHGYYIGNFPALERSFPDFDAARDAVAARFQEIAETARGLRIPVALVMFPAPVQVASPFELDYYPKHVRLDDTARFDVERPQREAAAIAKSLGFSFYDLRAPLRAARPCPFQPGNMHLRPHGHEAVARFLADQLLGDRMLPQ